MFICKDKYKQAGFTLLEILVALFIFSILSLILSGALRSVIDAHSGTESKAERLRSLQLALLMMSRDVEQAFYRPVMTAAGSEQAAFVGTSRSFTFTHTGLANPSENITRSALQRTQYFWEENGLWRATWPVLDQAPQTQARKRLLMTDVTAFGFEYLDKDKQFQNKWPVNSADRQRVPRAVKVTMTISQWGKITQIYMLPIQTGKTLNNDKEKTPKS